MNKILILALLLFQSAAINATGKELNDTAITPESAFETLSSSNKNEIDAAVAYIKKNKPSTLKSKLSLYILENFNDNGTDSYIDALMVYPPEETSHEWVIILEKTQNRALKKIALNAISRSRDKKAVTPLVNHLDNPYYEVREASIKALKLIGDDRVYPKILAMAESSNPVFRVYAAEALGHMFDRRFIPVITKMIKDENKSVRVQTIKLIEKNELNAFLFTIRSMAQNDPNYEVMNVAMLAMEHFRDLGNSYIIIKNLSNEHPEVRKTAALLIIKYQISRAVYTAAEQLEKEDDPELKNMLLEMLIQYKSFVSLGGLEKIITKDDSPTLRIKSAYVLGLIRGDRAGDILIKALDDPDYRVRSEACASLSGIYLKAGVKKMLTLVQNEKLLYVRTAALYSLEKLNDKETRIPLYDLLAGEKDPVFKAILRETLRNMIEKSI